LKKEGKCLALKKKKSVRNILALVFVFWFTLLEFFATTNKNNKCQEEEFVF